MNRETPFKKGVYFTLFLCIGAGILLISLIGALINVCSPKRQTPPII